MDILAPHNTPFAVALLLLVLFAVAQAIGLGDHFGDTDADLAADGEADASGMQGGVLGGLFTALGIGRVPLMVWLTLFLLAFAALGVSFQQLAQGLTGGPLDVWLAAIIAGGSALPLTGLLARPVGRILPKDETSAVTLDTLVGRRATIQTGTARTGSPARARVLDRHGHPHHVMVEPHGADGEIREGEQVLLVRREEERFFGQALADNRLTAIEQ